MPLVKADALEDLTYRAFRAVGSPHEDASVTAHLIVEANVVGHDSHGVQAVPNYLKAIREGTCTPGSPTEVVKEGPTYAIIDGHKNLGHIVAYRATQKAIEKARKSVIGVVALRRCNHLGRVGGYTEIIAEAGLAGMMFTGVGGMSRSVAPYGGAKGRTGTNPISMAFPSNLEGPILLDMATSVHAAGKVRVYERQGLEFPDDWLMDSEGRPTTDVKVYRKGGAMRTFGGYKGYGLQFFVEIFAGILNRDGHARELANPAGVQHSNGSFIIAIDPTPFVPLQQAKQEIDVLTAWMKSSPPAPGFTEVLYPGEPEARTRKERRANGIPLDDTTWNDVKKFAQELDLVEYLPPVIS
ncbi:MAG: Ldh family oxidoreductase [Chloroflexota bacterium]|nr:Ldh family oxidoreductase [Chloroflexota bacterium]